MRRPLLARFVLDRSGVAAMEFALLMPFLIVLIFTSFTVFQVIRATYVADKSTSTIADLMSRQTETSSAQLAQMKGVFEHLAIDLNNAPQLRISSLIRTAGGFVVDWTYNSRPGGTLANSDLPLSELPTIAIDDSVLLTESVVSIKPFMTIVPIFSGSTVVLAHKATTRPRFVGRLSRVD